jgi:glucose/arabinose dehydrogenase
MGRDLRRTQMMMMQQRSSRWSLDRGVWFVVAASFIMLLPFAELTAATVPPGFSESLVASGLSSPTAMEIAPDGRIFVCQQGGQLRVIKNGALLPTPFVSLNVNAVGERGLLGVAFDPNFATNGFVYLYYTTNTAPLHNRVVRFTANGDVAVPGSETLILRLDDLSSATNHNGGALHFGPDGKLYVAVGENANGANAQTFSNLLGKLLRINADGSIPADNPFFNSATGQNRAIWALGLRNPYTFAFQRGTGRMFINDVGQSTWEEINEGVAGSNHGWPATEGPTSDPQFRSPVFAYGRSPSSTGGCAITGGVFYNPAGVQFPAGYVGRYFFADFCSGWIRVFNPADGTAAPFASGIANPVDLRVGADGSLYYLARGSGQVVRVQYDVPARSDFNGDGHADLIWQNNITGQRAIWLMNGTTWVAERFLPNIPTQWHIAANGDFNSDGQVDIVWQNTSTGQRAIWLMNGTTWVGERFLPTIPTQWQIVGAADFNADAHTDIVWQNTSTGQRAIWLMNGTTWVAERFLPTIPLEWRIVGTGDFNRDRQPDLIWSNITNGQRAIWLMNGTTWVAERFLPVIRPAWQIAGSADFDRDGNSDLIWQNLGVPDAEVDSGRRAIWLMEGTSWVGERFLPGVRPEWEIRNR